ncbi:hypothetical protein IMSAGC003_02836 [Lachnospiraceae bacterium]|jgi:flagellar basal body-associated protein FliL|nr:hypothetical protein [Lachnospiraceae bacterium]MCX4271687.1 hypothetical protein [Acetatifactor sp.]GFH96281.1 hypothetical protein IMSAGC003_02836 [Lachnospiraceae bacterium]
MIVLKILLVILAVLSVLFLLSLAIYFFNLDMKFAAAMTPVMNKYYDWQKRKKEAKQKMNKETGSSE